MEQSGNRIGTEQRERALTELALHFGNGRLDAAEFDSRSARLAAATTRAELAELFTDLPAVGTAPATPAARRALPRLVGALVGATLCAVALVWFSGQWWWLLAPAAAAALAGHKLRAR